MAGDAFFESVSLLLHGDGANNSTTITDNSPAPKTVTAGGNAKISTAQSKWGGSSIYFDGAGDYVTVAANAAFGFGTDDFTTEAWIYIVGNQGADRAITDFRSSGSVGTFYINTSNKLAFYYGSVLGGSGSALTTNTWYHVALTRQSGVFRCYLNGAQDWTATATADFGSSAPVGIGASVAASLVGTSPFYGYFDDVRITKGVARYTGSGSFTPPSDAFLDYAGEVSGIIYDDTGSPCARTVRLVNRTTGAMISSTTSDSSTGAYRLESSTLGEVQRIVLDDSGGSLYNDLIDRVIPA